jgi:hypothetical protein
MARKLKTYRTSLGFFDLAIAAPSMKAALEAWGAPAGQRRNPTPCGVLEREQGAVSGLDGARRRPRSGRSGQLAVSETPCVFPSVALIRPGNRIESRRTAP